MAQVSASPQIESVHNSVGCHLTHLFHPLHPLRPVHPLHPVHPVHSKGMQGRVIDGRTVQLYAEPVQRLGAIALHGLGFDGHPCITKGCKAIEGGGDLPLPYPHGPHSRTPVRPWDRDPTSTPGQGRGGHRAPS
jgi:hypothetical protein